jgi:AraC-like DNA-binding protein
LISDLFRFSVRGKTGADSFEAAMAPFLTNPTFEFEPGSKDITAQVSVCRLQKIQIFSGRHEQPFRLKIPHATSFAQGFPSKGDTEFTNNGVVMRSSAGKGSITEPGEMNINFCSAFEQVCVFIEPAALVQVLAGVLGAPPGGELKLDSSNPERRYPAPLSFRLLRVLVSELAENTVPSRLVITELEQAMLVAFLCNTRHNYSHLLEAAPSDLAPRQVRRVEEYVETNWNQPISIGDLAIVANASARSIFQSFRKHRGYSPMLFVKQVRLRHVREMLNKPESATTITRAAFACGFGNLGHFANTYKQAFGESPSETLERSKGRSSLS